VLAYDVVPDGDRPVVVTIASEEGWSLVGVLGSARLTAGGAIAVISARGLDAATQPFAAAAAGTGLSRLAWLGPTRTDAQRAHAKVLASGRLMAPVEPAKPVKRPAKRAKKPTTKAGGRR
jgi:hypothetical protein